MRGNVRLIKRADGTIDATTAQTVTLESPVDFLDTEGYQLGEDTPRVPRYGEYFLAIDDEDGSHSADIERADGSESEIAWIVLPKPRKPVLAPRDLPTADVQLLPSNACIAAGYTPPLAIVEFRQPQIGEAYISRRYRHGHRFARVFLCETGAESRAKADGRWIVMKAEEAPRRAVNYVFVVTQNPVRPQRPVALSPETLERLRNAIARGGAGAEAALAILDNCR